MKTFLQTLFFFLLVTQICFAQWVQTNGPIGGYVNCFLVSGLIFLPLRVTESFLLPTMDLIRSKLAQD